MVQKKYYYEGIISGIGSDNEICISDFKQITYKDYISKRKELITENNIIANFYADKYIDLLSRGFVLGYTEEEIESTRIKYTK